MHKPALRTIDASSSINPLFLESALTADVSTLESLLDLIDNSIDSARELLQTRKVKLDKYGLLADYSGFKIHIRLGLDNISICDNCGGINEEALKNKAFNVAQESKHSFGIGHYGVGLKRSLLKFGKSYFMSSDDGITTKKSRFNSTAIGRKAIPVDISETAGKQSTLFVVSDIKPEVFSDIEREEWYEENLKTLSIRYAIYVQKGLRISVSSIFLKRFDRISGNIPSLRTNCKIKPTRDSLDHDGVRVFIESGVHEKYYFRQEKDDSVKDNKKLTNEFGLYFICNDRVIVVASKANEHGWQPAVWHSEYNGFVAIVRFVSEDSRKIPWNTLKTALRTESEVFSKTKKALKEIADKYRADARNNFRKTAPPTANSNDNKPTPSTNSLPIKNLAEGNGNKKNTASSIPAIDSPHLHIKNWRTLLPASFPCTTQEHILDAFIIEAAKLAIDDAPNAALILLRSVLEISLKKYVTDAGHYARIKDHYFTKVDAENKRKGKGEISEEHKQEKLLSLDMIIPWLKEKNVEIELYGANRPQLSLATKNAAKHLPKMNGVVHGNDAVDGLQVKAIRNEIYSLLLFCTNSISSK